MADQEEPKFTRAERKAQKKRKGSRFLKMAFGVVKWTFRWSLIILILGLTVFLIYRWQAPGDELGQAVSIEVPAGATFDDIGRKLGDEGVISSVLAFKLLARYQGVENKIQPGSYDFRENMTPSAALKVLLEGVEVRTFEVTIPEGFTIDQIAARLSSATPLDGSEFQQVATAFTGGSGLAFLEANETGSLEGYLFPQTYNVKEEATSAEFISQLLAQFEKETAGLDWSRVSSGELSLHEVITIASLIEKEARQPEERPLISAVVHNRLAKNMPLQIDATIQYILPERKSRLTVDDLEVESPYNTYKNSGLPPGPICNPGSAAIRAALKPASVDYLYYVLSDTSGRHTFTTTYEEFLEAKRKARSDSIAP